MSSKKHKNGVGIAGKHTSCINVAESVVDALRVLPDTRLILGIIKKVRRNGHRRIKFFNIQTGVRMKLTGNYYVQEITVITSIPRIAIKIANKVFQPD